METYHKIQTVYLRDPENNFKTLLEGEWAEPEFEMLKDLEWDCTEKIDGTNIRVLWDGEQVEFRGKTDKAQIPVHLLETLEGMFTNHTMFLQFGNAGNVCLYGEGYGKKIQKGGNYIPNGTNFILFDIKIGIWWLTREVCEEIAESLRIDIVPHIGMFTLEEAVEFVKRGFKSTIADNKDYMAEGLILKPPLELFSRNGRRIITKIKHKDFG